MMQVLLSVAVALVGLIVYALTTNAKVERLSLVAWGCGLLAVCQALATRSLHFP